MSEMKLYEDLGPESGWTLVTEDSEWAFLQVQSRGGAYVHLGQALPGDPESRNGVVLDSGGLEEIAFNGLAVGDLLSIRPLGGLPVTVQVTVSGTIAGDDLEAPS